MHCHWPLPQYCSQLGHISLLQSTESQNRRCAAWAEGQDEDERADMISRLRDPDASVLGPGVCWHTSIEACSADMLLPMDNVTPLSSLQVQQCFARCLTLVGVRPLGVGPQQQVVCNEKTQECPL